MTSSLSSSVCTLPHFLVSPRLVATVEVPDANMVGGARSLRQVQIAARSGVVSSCPHNFFCKQCEYIERYAVYGSL